MSLPLLATHLSGPLDRLNATLSLLQPLDRYRAPSAGPLLATHEKVLRTHKLRLLKAQLGEHFLETLLSVSLLFFLHFSAKPAFKSPKLALKWAKLALKRPNWHLKKNKRKQRDRNRHFRAETGTQERGLGELSLESSYQHIRVLPCPSFPCFFGIPCSFFLSLRGCLVFLTVFPFFSRDFRGSVGIKNPCFFGGFPCLFSKKKARKGRTGLWLRRDGLKAKAQVRSVASCLRASLTKSGAASERSRSRT